MSGGIAWQFRSVVGVLAAGLGLDKDSCRDLGDEDVLGDLDLLEAVVLMLAKTEDLVRELSDLGWVDDVQVQVGP